MSIPIDQLDKAAHCVKFTSPNRYLARARHLFEGISLQGKDVLDIGCGAGAWALWAGLNGARKVVGLEPEADGLIPGTEGAFERNIRSLGLSQTVQVKRLKLQEFATKSTFDVIILNNSINHLDEDAVLDLKSCEQARLKYRVILQQLYSLTRRGGIVIVTDCSRYNLWPSLHMRSPFGPTIEWRKHQSPWLWTQLFEDAGFVMIDLRWSPSYPLGALTANVLVSFLILSHFVLRFSRSKASFCRELNGERQSVTEPALEPVACAQETVNAKSL